MNKKTKEAHKSTVTSRPEIQLNGMLIKNLSLTMLRAHRPKSYTHVEEEVSQRIKLNCNKQNGDAM